VSAFSPSPLGTTWRKSTRSNADGSCVEVRRDHNEVHVRDTKNRRGPFLRFTTDSWRDFVAEVQQGHFDRRSNS
jgi:hypothetical protein